MKQDESGFWDLIGVLGGSSGEGGVARLREILLTRTGPQIEAFDRDLTEKLARLEQPPYAATIHRMPEVGASDDTALFVRCAVVAAGRERYTAVVENPELLNASWDITGADLLWGAAAEAFEEVTGKPLTPDGDGSRPAHLPWIRLVHGDAQLRPRFVWEPVMVHQQSRRLSADPRWLRWRADHRIQEVWIHLEYRHGVRASGTEELRVRLRNGVVWVTMRRDRRRLPRLPSPRAATAEADLLMDAVARRLRKRLGTAST